MAVIRRELAFTYAKVMSERGEYSKGVAIREYERQKKFE